MFEKINPHILKIVIAARKKDSIRAISKRIELSYGWTYKWVSKLIELGVFERKENRLVLNQKNRFYKNVLKFLNRVFSKDINFHYQVLELFGIKYCFTKTDAVFIWTNGGYNITRYSDYYPIFIKIYKKDRKIFQFYTKKLSLNKIFYKPEFLDDFSVTRHNKMPLDSLEETIKFMKKYKYNFQPALEMVKEQYNKKINISYREASTNV